MPVRDADGGWRTVEVLDGDTLRWPDGRRVRLVAVDAPETGRPGAEAAAAFTARFLAGRRLILSPEDPPHDRYGRLLADLQADGESLSRALLSAGWVWLYGDERDADLLARQAEAVVARRGVHAHLDRLPHSRWLVGAGRFHDGRCPLVRRRAQELAVSEDAEALFCSGLSPCRLCLVWPPSWPWPGPAG